MTAATEKPLTRNIRPDGSVLDLPAYERAGGYQAIRKVLSGGMTPQAVTSEVKDANLLAGAAQAFQPA
jgi:NADH-quinone oxidoreductase subunit F